MLGTSDPQVACRLVTRRYVEEMYGTLARCLADDEDDETLRGASVTDVNVSGSRATAAVEVPPADGLSRIAGTLELAREGGAWRVDRSGDDFLRSLLVAGAGKPGDSGLASSAPMRRCMQRRFAALPAATVRRLATLSSSRDPRLRTVLLREARRCPVALADYVATAIVDGLRGEGRSPAFLRCMHRQLRGLLAVTGLAERALRGNTDDAGTAALGGLALGAQQNCARAR